MRKTRLMIVTTTTETLATILKGQPGFLAKHFDVALCASFDNHENVVRESEKLPLFCVRMIRGISPFYDIASIVQMICVIRRFRPDIIHSYTPKAGLVSMLAAWFCGVPVRIHTFTGLLFPSAFGVKKAILKNVDRLLSFFATEVVPESAGVRSDLIKHGVVRDLQAPIGYGNIAGVDTAYYDSSNPDLKPLCSAFRKAHALTPGFSFCYVGRIHKDKGIDELVEAFSSLPGTSYLMLVGAFDEVALPSAKTLKLIEQHPRIRYLGFQSDIRPALFCSDVVVLPSYREGFPNVVLQSLSMSRPVIVSDVSGSNEITVPGHNGWIVPVADSRALWSAMYSAIRCSTDLLSQMGRNGRKAVLQKYERSWYNDKLLDFYKLREASIGFSGFGS
ncbi:MAG: glycosyltransferase family 4 protein [Pseudomonadota bacterium]